MFHFRCKGCNGCLAIRYLLYVEDGLAVEADECHGIDILLVLCCDGEGRLNIREVGVPAYEVPAFGCLWVWSGGILACIYLVITECHTIEAYEGDNEFVPIGKDCSKGHIVIHRQQAWVVCHVIVPTYELEAFVGGCGECDFCAVLVPAAAGYGALALVAGRYIHLEEQRVLTYDFNQLVGVNLTVGLVGMFQYESAVLSRVP